MTQDLATGVAENNLPLLFVGHVSPDPDLEACLWLQVKTQVDGSVPWKIKLIRSGETLPKEEQRGFRVVHLDTGRGEFDNHGKTGKDRGKSSFALLAEHYGMENDPGITDILGLTVKADNIEPVAFTDGRYILKSYAHHMDNKVDGETDWALALADAFKALDGLYMQGVGRRQNEVDYEAFVKAQEKLGKSPSRILHNGIKITFLPFKPQWRDAAWKSGTDVVVCITRPKKGVKDKIQIFFAVNLKSNYRLNLRQVLATLRKRELEARRLPIPPRKELMGSEIVPGAAQWFGLDNMRWASNGSLTHPLEADEEFSVLELKEILGIARTELSKLPALDRFGNAIWQDRRDGGRGEGRRPRRHAAHNGGTMVAGFEQARSLKTRKSKVPVAPPVAEVKPAAKPKAKKAVPAKKAPAKKPAARKTPAAKSKTSKPAAKKAPAKARKPAAKTPKAAKPRTPRSATTAKKPAGKQAKAKKKTA